MRALWMRMNKTNITYDRWQHFLLMSQICFSPFFACLFPSLIFHSVSIFFFFENVQLVVIFVLLNYHHVGNVSKTTKLTYKFKNCGVRNVGDIGDRTPVLHKQENNSKRKSYTVFLFFEQIFHT